MEIEHIRAEHDYLYGKIPPHITLVFPFSTSLSDSAISEVIDSEIAGKKPIKLRISGLVNFTPQTSTEEWIIALGVIRGTKELHELYQQLNSKIEIPGFVEILRNYPFNPHVTVGRFTAESDFLMAAKILSEKLLNFDAVLDELILEEIQYDLSSKILRRFILS